MVFENARQQLLIKWRSHFMFNACNCAKEHSYIQHAHQRKDLKPKALRFWLVLPYFVKASLIKVSSLCPGCLASFLENILSSGFVSRMLVVTWSPACLAVVSVFVCGG